MTGLAHDAAKGPGGAAEPSGVMVRRVEAGDRRRAVGRLLGVHPTSQEVSHWLEDAQRHGLDLSLMWMARSAGEPEEGEPGQVCLVTPGSGRTATFFVSGPGLLERLEDHRGGLARQERAAAIIEAVRHFERWSETGAPQVHLGQALLEPGQEAIEAAYADAGFMRLAELDYLRRELPRRAPEAPAWSAGVEVRPLTAWDGGPRGAGWALLREALPRTYEGTLDCPALCGLREIDDVLESHRSVGVHDPSLWFLVLQGGRAEGCMLLAPGAGTDAVELVYIGLSPAVRGRGLGAALLQLAVRELCLRGERTLACAVDRANTPALRLYARLKFRSFTRRVAMVRSLRAGR